MNYDKFLHLNLTLKKNYDFILSAIVAAYCRASFIDSDVKLWYQKLLTHIA